LGHHPAGVAVESLSTLPNETKAAMNPFLSPIENNALDFFPFHDADSSPKEVV
jgi:hypothetical protein